MAGDNDIITREGWGGNGIGDGGGGCISPTTGGIGDGGTGCIEGFGGLRSPIKDD